MTLVIAKPAAQPIEKGVWEMAGDYIHCDSCGGMIVRYDSYIRFRTSHGALCLDCAAPKRGER